jgi:acyl carrier protein
MADDVKAEVSRFIHEEVLWEDDGTELSEDAPLLDGVLDSFGLRSLLSFLDERFGVAVSNTELVAENFQSIETISAFVESKRAAGD